MLIESDTAPYALTSGCFLFLPERTYEVAGNINQKAPGDSICEVEVYPVQDFQFPLLDQMGINVDKVVYWEREHEARTARVHIEFAYDKDELGFQSSLKSNQHPDLTSVLMHKLLYHAIKDARSETGINLARELGVGVNMHTNVAIGLTNDDLLEEFLKYTTPALIENSIDYNCPVPNAEGPILYDPRLIVREMLYNGSAFDGLLLGYDHLVDYYSKQGLSPMEVMKDKAVTKAIRAVHLASPNHQVIKIGDPDIETFVAELKKQTDRGQVQMVFDYSPLAVLKNAPTKEKQIQLFRETIDWIDAIKSAN